MSAITFTRDEFKNYCKSIDLLTGVNASCTALKAEFNHKNQEWKIQAKKDGQNKVCAKNRGCNFLATYSVTKDLLNIQLLASKYLIGPEIQEVWRCINTNDAVVITSLLNGDNLATYIKSNLGNIHIITRLVISVYYMIQTLHKLGYVLGNADQLDKIIGNHKKITEKQFRVYITDFSKTRLDASSELRNNDYKMFYAAITKLTGGDEIAQHIVQYVHSHYLREKLDVPPPLESVKQEIKQEVVKQVQAQAVIKEQQVQQQPDLNTQPDEFHDLPEPIQQLTNTQKDRMASFQKKNESELDKQVAPNVVMNTLKGVGNLATGAIGAIGGGLSNLIFGGGGSSPPPVVVKQEYPPPGEVDVIKDDEQESNPVAEQTEQKSNLDNDFSSVSSKLAEMKKQGLSLEQVVKVLDHNYKNYKTLEKGEFTIYPTDDTSEPVLVKFDGMDQHLTIKGKYPITKKTVNNKKVQVFPEMNMILIEYMLYVYNKVSTSGRFMGLMKTLSLIDPEENVYTYSVILSVDCLHGDLICSDKQYCLASSSSLAPEYRKCVELTDKYDNSKDEYPRYEIKGLKNQKVLVGKTEGLRLQKAYPNALY